jgi:PAS domain S-box-containing protein
MPAKRIGPAHTTGSVGEDGRTASATTSRRGRTNSAWRDQAQALTPPPQHQLIYDTAPIGLAFLSSDCRYLHINRSMTEICGISVADHIGRSVRDTVPAVADHVESIVHTILRTGEPITGVEVNGQRPDGGNARRCWITYWHPLKNKDGSIAGINVAAQEITERKHSEAALAVAEQRYRALVRATSSLVWTTSPDGQVVDIPEWRTYTGQSVAQAKGWGWLAALHPDDREHTAVVWQKAVDTRSLYETEYRIRRSDGVYIWHQARGVAIIEDDGSIREWVGICLDIDLRKRATERQIEADKTLRDLNQFLEQRVEAEARERSRIWNVSQDLLAVGDTKGRIISINPAWTEALGWSEDELLLKSGEWLVHPDDLEKSQKEQISLVEGRKTGHFENRIRDKLGKYHVVSWRAVPDQGRIYAVGRDVTELRDAEEQLRASRRELARVSQQTAVGVATASIAHEINQPLAAIVANANAGLRWLDRPVPNIAEVRAVLERIVRDGHHTKEVISGIRDMFGKGRLERAFLNLNTLIEEVLALMRRELESHQVLLRTQMADGLPDVLVERVQLQQVLVNLITNAVDAMSSEPGRTRQLTITSELHNAPNFPSFLHDQAPRDGNGSIHLPVDRRSYLQLPRTGDVRGPS